MIGRAAVAIISRWDQGARLPDADLVPVEAPLHVALTQPGRRHTVPLGLLMRTPGEDEELVTGLLVGEGVVRRPEDLAGVTLTTGGDESADAACVSLSAEVDLEARVRPRALVVTSACGLCGRLELQALDARAPGAAGRPIHADVLMALPGKLRAGQPVFDQTGGLHAAGLFSPDGEPHVLREDVGRHNAVDKVVGAAWRAGLLPDPDLLLAVSGRVAFEIVQKAAMAGLGAIVAVGAPSSLAVEAARAADLVLVGFARGGRANIYAGRRVR
jgi:FdhD protein